MAFFDGRRRVKLKNSTNMLDNLYDNIGAARARILHCGIYNVDRHYTLGISHIFAGIKSISLHIKYNT